MKKYLSGEDLIVQKLGLVRDPTISKDDTVDSILIYLQENSQGVSVSTKIDDLSKAVRRVMNITKQGEDKWGQGAGFRKNDYSAQQDEHKHHRKQPVPFP